MAATDQPDTKRASQWPDVLPIGPADIAAVLLAGIADFRKSPLHGLAFGAIYAVGGWILVALLVFFDLPFLVYPLAAGFALIAPFVATGFYAISLLLEQNRPVAWEAIFHLIWRAARRDLGWMALVTGFSIFIWMDIAALLFFGFLGIRSMSLPALLTVVFTTPTGLLFLVIGNGAGAIIALGVFSFSVTSFPMLFDRDCDFVTAMVSSVRVVLANKPAMVLWCAIIAVTTGLSLLSGFVGLFVTLPILGHASWHLYRRALAAPAESTDSAGNGQ